MQRNIFCNNLFQSVQLSSPAFWIRLSNNFYSSEMLANKTRILKSVPCTYSLLSELHEKLTSFLSPSVHAHKDAQIGSRYEALNTTNFSLRLYGEKRQNCYFSLCNVHMVSSTLSSKSGKVMLQVCR